MVGFAHYGTTSTGTGQDFTYPRFGAEGSFTVADTKSDADRSRNMAAVRSGNTKPELLLRKALWRRGLRYFTARGWKHLSGSRLPGSPDLIFLGARVVVFVDGCFWHGCPEHYSEPDDNREFWRNKLAENRSRDLRVNSELCAAGWKVLRFWEHELRRGGIDTVVTSVIQAVRGVEYSQKILNGFR